MAGNDAGDAVRRCYRGLRLGDTALLSDTLHARSTWATPGRAQTAGLREGRAEVLGQLGRYAVGTRGTFRMEPVLVMADAQGHAVGIHRSTALRRGRSLDVMCCIEFEVREGRILSAKEHFFDLYAWDAFWS